MTGLRVLAIGVFLTLVAYTAVAMANDGPNLFPIFFGDMAKMQWPGQFNLDFTFMLTFSALWVAWRHNFSMPGLVFAAFAFVGGALFLSLYLFAQSFRSENVKSLILGERE